MSGALGLLLAVPTHAAKFNRVIEIGQTAPAWSDLLGVDGKRHSLNDHPRAKAVVVVFLANHCPVVKAYESRLIALSDDYRSRGVEVVAISVSRVAADRFEKMQTRAKTKGYNFPYLVDPTQKIGQAYGATCTPHVFLLAAQRRIDYMGAIDDNRDPAKVKRHYLRDAIEAVLAGRRPEVTESLQRGCTIEYAGK